MITYSYRSQRNYTRPELAKKLCTRLTYQAEHDSLEAKRNTKVEYRKPGVECSPKARYGTYKSVSAEHTHIIKQ